MSAHRNHGSKKRIREFAKRSGFTYQQAQQFLVHFDSLSDSEPDEDGLQRRIVLCSDIQVGDVLLAESGEGTWIAGPGMLVTSVEQCDDGFGSFVRVDTDQTSENLLPHAQTVVLRSPPEVGQWSALTYFLDAREDLNAHLGSMQPTEVLRRLGIGA